MNTQAVQQPRSTAPATFVPGRGLLLQRKCACGGNADTSGECEACRNKKRLQAKLAIGASNDPLEMEADRIADQCWQGRCLPRSDAPYQRGQAQF